MSSILQGLTISLASIIVTFAFFGLLVLVMVLLRESFKVSPKATTKVEQIPTQEQPRSAQEIYRLRAAGIAVLVASLKAKGASTSLGELLNKPPGRWWGKTHGED